MQGCQLWRTGYQCAKHGTEIEPAISVLANIHDESICEVRRQINIFRMHDLLERK